MKLCHVSIANIAKSGGHKLPVEEPNDNRRGSAGKFDVQFYLIVQCDVLVGELFNEFGRFGFGGFLLY
uniref:Uncharacterized protein n=1 Tax=Romanomermis culicivorax TaxID=13658 RepID=A0A915LE76_ROMCU